MQLRQIIAEDERRLFAQALARARASRGVGIRQCAQSRLENSHITFGRLYALYER